MKTARITFTGDIMCAPGQTERTMELGLICPDGHPDYSYVCRAVKPYLSDCDLLVGNLETPIAGEDMLYTHERYCFNTPDSFAGMLSEYGFGLLCLANNHCMDRGEAGIDRTLDTLDRLGIPHTGIYRSAAEHIPCVMEVGGIRVAFVNYTYGTNAFAHHRFLSDGTKVNLFQPEETLPGSIHLLESMGTVAARTEVLYYQPNPDYDKTVAPYLDKLSSDIRAAKDAADFVIAVMHSGSQYNPMPDAYSRMLADKLRRMGADAIIAHHPHVIHPTETVDGIFTAYSISNFNCVPSIMGDPENARWSPLLTLTLTEENGHTTLSEITFRMLLSEIHDGIPHTEDAYDRWCEGTLAADEILRQVNNFSPDNTYTAVQPIYHIKGVTRS